PALARRNAGLIASSESSRLSRASRLTDSPVALFSLGPVSASRQSHCGRFDSSHASEVRHAALPTRAFARERDAFPRSGRARLHGVRRARVGRGTTRVPLQM